jgi:uncharacterized protein involved in response to NO
MDNKFSLFSYGFRPFFLLAGLYANVAVTTWLWLFLSDPALTLAMPAMYWHGHEMIYGFVAAAIGGFMLTAVPSWTGSRGFAGLPLVSLATIWLLGRIAFAISGHVPIAVLVTAELLYLPALALLITPSLLRSPNRNSPLLLVLAAFWALDFFFLRSVMRGDFLAAQQALHSSLDVVLLLITVIGGRIVPAFTQNALKARGIDARMRHSRPIETLVIGSMLALIVAGFFPRAFVAGGIVAAVASVAHFVRLAGWQGLKTRSDPIVWVLHIAYLWMPIGLSLKAFYVLGGFSFAAHWFHALGAGAAATMILAVMTRASLGHTGRPLHVARPVVWAYGMLIAAILFRVFGPALLPVSYGATIAIAAGLWLGAFLVFVAFYAPILSGPRADGKPG